MKDITEATKQFKKCYGVDYPMQSPELVKSRVRNFRSESDLALEDDICECIRKDNSGDDRIFKDIIKSTLTKLGIVCMPNKQVDEFTYDLYLSDMNILIQICPTITHNDVVSFDENGKGISSMLHKQEADCAHAAGYECIHIFDWDSIFILIELLKNNADQYSDCRAEQIDKLTYNIFCQQYFIGNPNKPGTLNYGLYHDNDLLAVMSFRKSTSSRYDWEIVRYCETRYRHSSIYIKSLIDKFIADNKSTNIVMYVDQSKYSGKELLSAGFKDIGMLYPQRIWSKGTQRILHVNISGRTYDEVFHTHYNSNHSLYTQMIEHGWLPIYDCGKNIYVYSEV